MTDNHPITPPPELVNLWMSEDAPWDSDSFGVLTARPSQLRHIATQAARWGADTELEACCTWISYELSPDIVDMIRTARRPKPPSLKEQALQHVGLIQDNWARLGDGLEAPPSLTGQITLKQLEDIRRALEALPND